MVLAEPSHQAALADAGFAPYEDKAAMTPRGFGKGCAEIRKEGLALEELRRRESSDGGRQRVARIKPRNTVRMAWLS